MEKEINGNGWKGVVSGRGTIRIQCNDWDAFNQLVHSSFINFPTAIYRGQADSNWKLTPTLERLLDSLSIPGDQNQQYFRRLQMTFNHLRAFQYASRGRRDSKSNTDIDDHDYWWSLGQHHGLATPLLDWSESPYVAAYFAFWEEHGDEGHASVFVLSRGLVEGAIIEEKEALKDEFDENQVVRFIYPFVDDNARLINQRGLFTISPSGKCLWDWVEGYFEDGDRNPLIEIRIPRSERSKALRSLNRMNVNALTLFPDLTGSSEYCNAKLRDGKY